MYFGRHPNGSDVKSPSVMVKDISTGPDSKQASRSPASEAHKHHEGGHDGNSSDDLNRGELSKDTDKQVS